VLAPGMERLGAPIGMAAGRRAALQRVRVCTCGSWHMPHIWL
jgi:hypothetical protein